MKVNFVCTGNTCRSPMAAAIFKRRMLDIGRIDFICDSSGLAAAEGHPASANAIQVCEEIGLDLSQHLSHRLRGKDMVKTNLFVVMEPIHQQILVEAGIAPGQVYVLGGGIADPFGKDIDAFRACRDEIEAAMPALEHFVRNEAAEAFKNI